MTTVTRPRPGTGSGGVPARRAVFRWGWRLFRREWRQQLLVLAMLTGAVAATVWGIGVVTNVQLSNPNAPTFGSAAAMVTLPGDDPHLAADIASIEGRFGPADVIENQDIATGTTQPVQLRAESAHGHFNAPLLGLVSGGYPAGPGQVALTSQVATLYGAHVGGSWRAAGRAWRVTGIVQDPSNLADEFALVAPGQVRHPSQVTMLLGPAGAQLATGPGSASSALGIPAATAAVPAENVGGPPQAVLILVVEVLGLAFIGLLSVASFSVLAQRRLRALGMLSAIGATEGNLRLVMIVNGLAVGLTAGLAGTAAGLAAWLGYVPTLQQASGHVVDGGNLPWWAIGIAVAFAVGTAVLASRRPARTMAAVPVVAALAGRPALPRAVHRSAVPGVIAFAAGLACLTFAGGTDGPPAGRGGGALLLLAGLAAVITGIFLLAPLAIGVLAAGAGLRPPVAIRIALRDLVRYRARSGAALAATTFAVFLATVICLVASVRDDSPLGWAGPNLAGNQLVFYAQESPAPGMAMPLGNAQLASLTGRLNGLAASWHARLVPLENAAMLYVPGAQQNSNFTGPVYVATPRLLATYGIRPGQVAANADVLSMRPGLAGVSQLEMVWPRGGGGDSAPGGGNGPGGGPVCSPGNGCLARPVIQTVANLPSGRSAPNTVITEHAVREYHLQAQLSGWLIQTPAALSVRQLNAARRLALSYEVTVESKSGEAGLGEIASAGIALGLLIALGVLAMSVGLIRSETARDLRTLTATGASAGTRRTITAATTAALGLLGAVLGVAGALIVGLAWAHSSLSAMFNHVLLTDVLILLIGLPLVAAAGGWLLAGREPAFISRQPLD